MVGRKGAYRSCPKVTVTHTCCVDSGVGQACDLGMPKAVFLSWVPDKFSWWRLSEDTGGVVGRCPLLTEGMIPGLTLDLLCISVLISTEDTLPIPVSSTLTFPQMKLKGQTSESVGRSS